MNKAVRTSVRGTSPTGDSAAVVFSRQDYWLSRNEHPHRSGEVEKMIRKVIAVALV